MSIQITSVSCPGTGRNQDCGVLVLMQFLGNHGVIVTYEEIRRFIEDRYRPLGIEFGDEQIGKDLFEAALLHFLPDHEVEFYNLTYMPGQRRQVTSEIINRGARNKSSYRLILMSSWDRQRNTQGAGHFALLNTRLATRREIEAALEAGNFEENRFRMTACIGCGAQAHYCEENRPERTWCSEACHKFIF
jgi:hypothetical protein